MNTTATSLDPSDERGCALVTGGARGIGRATVRALARDGFDVVIDYTSMGSAEAAEDLAAQVSSEFGVEAIAIRADVSDFSQAAELMKAAAERFGWVEVLVNNAGITRDGSILRMTEENFDAVIDVNLKGAFNCIRNAAGGMVKHRQGRIISLSSVSGVMGNPGQANYSASKAGIIGLTKTVARELAGRNITVNAVAPGFIGTDMTAAMPEKVLTALVDAIPLKRMGSPEDIAETISFLASSRAAYITGQVLCVDGGMAI